MASSIVIENGKSIQIEESIVAPVGEPAVNITGDNAQLQVDSEGSISALDDGNTAVLSSGNGVEIQNSGEISGALNGISSSGDSFTLENDSNGTITSDSRAVDITDGNNITTQNSGSIFGTGDQRNGTFYIDGTIDNINFGNESSGVIDAGLGNSGDGFSIQVGDVNEDALNDSFNLNNRGLIAGRGQAEFAPGEGRLTANGSSGVRFFNGFGDEQANITGTFNNTGSITSEVNVGFLGGFVVEDGVGYQGQINNSGLISGPRNGLYIGDAEHHLEIRNESNGIIESGSRAVNLDGDNVTFNNDGSVLGTDDQRDGTLYVDGTGDNIAINNFSGGIIDAGKGNSGSGISIQVGTAGGLSDGSDDTETSVDLVNDGLIKGRGTENVPAGLRLFVGSGLTESTFTGNIINEGSGIISSEQDAGLLIEEGIDFNGQIVNDGTISGGNGLAINAAGASGNIEVINTGVLQGDLVLGDGDDILLNNSSDDLNITAGAGNDILTGGSGVNIYSFDTDFGQDLITDFQISQDVLDFGSLFADADQALGSATQIGSDAFIDLGNDNSLTLANIEVASLTEHNFSFG